MKTDRCAAMVNLPAPTLGSRRNDSRASGLVLSAECGLDIYVALAVGARVRQ